jgi:hypothetical protein
MLQGAEDAGKVLAPQSCSTWKPLPRLCQGATVVSDWMDAWYERLGGKQAIQQGIPLVKSWD